MSAAVTDESWPMVEETVFRLFDQIAGKGADEHTAVGPPLADLGWSDIEAEYPIEACELLFRAQGRSLIGQMQPGSTYPLNWILYALPLRNGHIGFGYLKWYWVVIHWMAEWEDGGFLGKDDSACLLEAAEQGLTLVFYDRRTIPPLLKIWAEEGWRHAGVIFVDEKTISPADIGGLVRALFQLVKETGKWDWIDRVYFLGRQP